MPVSMKVNIDKSGLKKATTKAAGRVIPRQGAFVRKIARNLIKRRKTQYAPAGHPPHTRMGKLKNAIRFGVDRKGRITAFIGPTRSGIGLIGATHEFGGTEEATPTRIRKQNYRLVLGGSGPLDVNDAGQPTNFAKLRTDAMVLRARKMAARARVTLIAGKKRRRYPKRPFMRPALEIAAPKLASFWKDAIGPGGQRSGRK